MAARLNRWSNDIPPRLQWEGNHGYCGEVSLISAGLYYGQYVSQYDARAIASSSPHQKHKRSQLLIGVNDLFAASQMRLRAEAARQQPRTSDFLAWVKQCVVKGHPVAIGVFTNEYRFWGDRRAAAGDAEYDHIVSVLGIRTRHALRDPRYFGDDVITFSDHGLWGPAGKRPFRFRYACDSFQKTRQQANATSGTVYSIKNDGDNYGVAIIGVADRNHDTVPVRVDTNVNAELPAIADGANKRPAKMDLTLTITVSGLSPGVPYMLYRYGSFAAVPEERFNDSAARADKRWRLQLASGTRYVMTEQIRSDEIAVYRAVRADAP